MDSKSLDVFTTILGLLAGVSEMLASQGVKPEITGTVGAIALAVLGVLTNRKPKDIIN
jgi:hypothetical protein